MNSLFWRIFLCFWLSNIAVLISAIYFTWQSQERQQQTIIKQQLAERIGNIILPGLKQPQSPISRRSYRQLLKKRFKIQGPNGEVLLDNLKPSHATNTPSTKNHKLLSRELKSYTFIDDDNVAYQILIPMNKVEYLLSRQLKQMMQYRFLLLLLASAMVSYLLTRMITTPLKALGQQAKQFSSDQQCSVGLSLKLLQRRDEIGALATELNAMQSNISLLVDQKQQLLHDVSHELRAPLARLVTATALFQQRYPQHIDLIYRTELECQRMSDLIDQILSLSHIERYSRKATSTNILPVIKNSIDDCQFEFPDQDIALAATPAFKNCYFDESLAAMVFNNVIRNACLHNSVDAKIDINCWQTDKLTSINVLDWGGGVEEQQLPSLLNAFVKYGDHAGSGLGLNICQRAMSKMHGQIIVNNHYSADLERRGLSITLEFLQVAPAPLTQSTDFR